MVGWCSLIRRGKVWGSGRLHGEDLEDWKMGNISVLLGLETL